MQRHLEKNKKTAAGRLNLPWESTKLISVLLMVILFFAYANFAHAQNAPGPNFLSCVSSPFSCIVFGTSWVINSIMNLLVALGAWLVRIMLQFNEGVINAPAVQAGFSVSLAVANLGFVLGIIVIALATILRRETYGIKQILWKLVVAAIIVNFALVIAGAIIGFSDTLANYFLRAASTSGDSIGFVNSLTSAFAPQSLLQPTVIGNARYLTDTSYCLDFIGNRYAYAICTAGVGVVRDVSGASTLAALRSGDFSDFTQFLQMVLSMVFGTIFLFIIAFTFLALAVLLLIRYVMMVLLLILAPLAWLMWIFPKFSHHFTKWWSEFLRWAFFPALTIFFLYLAILTAQNTSYVQNALSKTAQGNNTQEAALIAQTANPGLLASAGQEIVVIGLALGGLFAANKFSIAGAGVAMGAMKSVGKAAQGYVGQQSKKAIRAAVPERVKEKLQAGEYKFAPKRVQSWLGQGFRKVEKVGGSDLVDKEHRWAYEMAQDPKEAARVLSGSRNGQQQFALIKALLDKNELKSDQTVNGKPLSKFLENENKVKFYGQSKLQNDVYEKLTGANGAAVNAAGQVAAGNPDAPIVDKDGVVNGKVGETVKAIDLMNAAMKKFVDGLSKSDVAKMDWNAMFSNKTLADPRERLLREQLLKNMAMYAPQLAPSAIPKMKSEQLKQFADMYKSMLHGQFDELVNKIGNAPPTPDQEASLDRLGNTLEAFNQSMVNNRMFAGYEPGAGGAGAPPPLAGGGGGGKP